MSRFAISTAIGFVWQRQHNQNPSGEKMAKITKARRKEPAAGSALNAQIRAAKGKATREVRRHAEANKIKLAMADKNRELFQIVKQLRTALN